jgi:hypothetical protein
MDTKKLKRSLEKISPDGAQLMNVGEDVGHYLPQHQTQMAATATSAVEYLKAQRFDRAPASPLDPAPVETEAQKATYERTLAIAEHPTNVLAYIKNGTLTPKDIQDLQTLYPGVYQALSSKLYAQIMDKSGAGKSIPYTTRIGLSMFLATPLDSTMVPTSIQAAQESYMGGAQQQPPQPKGTSTKNLGKMPQNYNTPGQAREGERAAGK